MALNVTLDNFSEEVLDSKLPVILDFWAPWCGPCRIVEPIMDKLASEFEGRVVAGKINVDEQSELANQFKVMSIPSIFILKNGNVVERMVGARPEKELRSLLEKHL